MTTSGPAEKKMPIASRVEDQANNIQMKSAG